MGSLSFLKKIIRKTPGVTGLKKLPVYPPGVVYLIVNNICNAQCVMCDVGQRDRDSVYYQNMIQQGDQEMRMETLQKLVSEVAGYKPRFHINGVEPLLYGKIIETVRLLKSSGFFTQIITNGILLEKYAKDLVELGIDNIRVSLDGWESRHDEIRGPGVFRKAIRGIEAVQRARTLNGVRYPKLSVNFTVTHLNYTHLTEFAQAILKVEGVDEVQFKHLFFITPEMSAAYNSKFADLALSSPTNLGVIRLEQIDTRLLWEQFQRVKALNHPKINFWPDISSRKGIKTYYEIPPRPIGDHKCIMPWKTLHMQPNGDLIIHPRCVPYKVGNINEASFQEIWEGPLYLRFRRALYQEDGLFPICTRCCGIF